jgi:hypothetical protein
MNEENPDGRKVGLVIHIKYGLSWLIHVTIAGAQILRLKVVFPVQIHTFL